MRKLLTILALLIPSIAWATACPSGYSYMHVFGATAIGSTQTNIPLVMTFNGVSPQSITYPDLLVVGSGGKVQSSSGLDIIFCDASTGGNLLSFERVAYSSTDGKAEFWIKESSLSATTPTYVYMFYGKAGASDVSNPTDVWSNGYGMVHHYPNGTSLTVADSTSNGNNGSIQGSLSATTGAIGGGIAAGFSTSNYIQVASSASFKPTSAVTYEGCTKSTTLPAGWILSIPYATSGWSSPFTNGLAIDPSNVYIMRLADSGGGQHLLISSGSAITTNVQYCFAATYDGTTMRLYKNGVADVTTTTASFTIGYNAGTQNMAIGMRSQYSAGDQLSNTVLDEVRVSTSARSADWIATQAANSIGPVGFWTSIDSRVPAGLVSGGNCVPITIDHTQVPNTNRTDYQFLVRGRYGWMADISSGGYAVNGNNAHDIRFFSDSICTSSLQFERVFRTSTTGDSAFWVLVPSVSHTVDTTIYASIGNPAFTSDASTTAVFSSYGWVGRYHLGSPGTFGYSDSGSAGLSLVDQGTGSAVGSISPTGGAFYSATNDNGTSAYAAWVVSGGGDHLGAHGYPVGTPARTVTAWFKLNPNSNYLFSTGSNGLTGTIFAYGNSDSQSYSLTYGSNFPTGTTDGAKTGTCIQDPYWNASTSPHAQCQAASQSNPTASIFIDGRTDFGWHQIVSVFPTGGGNLNSILTYIDGQLSTPAYTFGTAATAVNTTDTVGATCGPGTDPCSNITVGVAAVADDAKWVGTVAEPGVSTNVLTADDIATRYTNQWSPWTFYSFGTSAPVSYGYVRHRVVRF
jgi:hypothetical protein